MQFLEFLSLLKKRGQSYALIRISFPSPKTWFIICKLWNFFPFSKNVDYHMKFLEFISLLQKRRLSMQFLEFPYLIQSGLSYAILGISFPFKNIDYYMHF